MIRHDGFSALRHLLPLLLIGLLAAGCVPPKKKTAEIDSGVPASSLWRRLLTLEQEAGRFGAISTGGFLMAKGEPLPGAAGTRRYNISLVVDGQLRAPAAEGMVQFDTSPAAITGIEVTALREVKEGAAETSAYVTAKGRAGWRLRAAEGSVPMVRQSLFLHVDVPLAAETVELRIQKYFKKANGDLLNTLDGQGDLAKMISKLAADIESEQGRAAGDEALAWAGVDDCAVVKGEERDGLCYPTDTSYAVIKEHLAQLATWRWTEVVTLKREPAKPQAGVAEEAPKPHPVPKAPEPAKAVEKETPAPAPHAVEEHKAVIEHKTGGHEAVEEHKAEAPKPKPKPAPAKKEVKKEPKPEPKGDGKPLYDLSDVLGKE